MPDRVLLFLLTPLSSPHLEVEVELALEHAAAGDDVHVAVCEASMPSCEGNPERVDLACVLCRSRQRDALERAGVDAEHRHVLRPDDVRPPTMPQLADREDLRAFTVDGVDLGEGILSSLVTWRADPRPDLRAEAPLLARVAHAAWGVHVEARRVLREVRPDRAYVFNGRFATIRPVVRACQVEGVEHRIHESSYELGRYRVVDAPMVHDLEAAKADMARVWAAGGPDREAVGLAYFEGRRHGGDGDALQRWRFRDRMAPSGTTAVERDERRRVVVFNGSEDEHVGIGEFSNPVYDDQMDGLERLVVDPRLSGCDVVVRVHPNLASRDNEQTRRLATMAVAPNVTVLPASSPANSYDLVDAADVVLCFGSTLGIEAVHQGVPSVLVGRAIWEDLGVVRPRSHDEVVDALLGPLTPPDPSAALRWGHWVRRNGRPFRHLVQHAYDQLTLDGRPIDVDATLRLGAALPVVGAA